MEPEQAVYQRLAGDAAIVAVVGDRIYPDEADLDAPMPLLVYGVVAAEKLRNLRGDIVMSRTEIQILAEAATKEAAVSLRQLCFASLNAAFAGGKCFYSEGRTEKAERGFESILTFTIWQ